MSLAYLLHAATPLTPEDASKWCLNEESKLRHSEYPGTDYLVGPGFTAIDLRVCHPKTGEMFQESYGFTPSIYISFTLDDFPAEGEREMGNLLLLRLTERFSRLHCQSTVLSYDHGGVLFFLHMGVLTLNSDWAWQANDLACFESGYELKPISDY